MERCSFAIIECGLSTRSWLLEGLIAGGVTIKVTSRLQVHFHRAYLIINNFSGKGMPMRTLTHIEGAPWEEVELPELDGEAILHPTFQCELCGEAISRKWADITGKCGNCVKGNNQVGRYIDRIYTVGVFISDTRDHPLTSELRPPKDGTYADKKARILQWGIENLDELDQVELMVPPPSASDPEGNHMVATGELLSDYVDIPFRNITRGDYPPQTEMETAEDRMENVDGEVKCIDDLSGVGTVLVIDDIVTTCSTQSDTARALLDAGADRVLGLGATRSIDFDGLIEAGLMEEK